MSQSYGKNHFGDLPSPVMGMNLGNWLGQARTTEDQLVAFLASPGLDSSQKAKVQALLGRMRSKIYGQLDRIR